MTDKEYLRQLKEEDYIAWDSIVNDPMVTGSGSEGDFILPIIFLIIFAAIILYIIS
jgi:hypothetical protein